MEELRQTKNFTKRDYRLSENKLFYNHSKFGNSNEIDIPFENIEGEKVSHKISNNNTLFFSVLVYIVAIALFISKINNGGDDQSVSLFWAVIATIILAFYWFNRDDFWKIKLTDNNYLYIHKNIPNKEIPENFINSLISKRNEYLKENYLIIDENLDYQSQLSNFKWLKSIGAISKIEFEEKYLELKATVNPRKTDIGFGK
ncbi:hypothetical protein ULMA_05440 [Patiriisocius marinus]|uniref:Uncharacterized protein n=1 Tax=Patiriisocius marinus TaxID=1397112 RepID=A0A5J4IUN4_9FLAO|nr:hypothetical protein [Patiriisocius marinus]GER58436.1 hypothetical protein ULMA_05440 [Patiriisocius marinus]